MGLFEPGSSQVSLERFMGIPKKVVGSSIGYATGMLRSSVELVLPPQTPRQQVEEMKITRPLREAQLGEETLLRGNKIEQSGLIVWGGLMIVTSILKAERTTIVPDEVTRKVCAIAQNRDALPITEPYLRPEVFEPAEELVDRYLRVQDNVRPLFSEGQR